MNRTRSDDARHQPARLRTEATLPAPVARARRARRTPAAARALAAAATAGALVGLGIQAPSAQGAGACPADFASVATATAEERLADHDGDGFACRITVDRRDGTRLMALTDNEASGLIVQVAPAACVAPSHAVGVGNPNEFPVELRPHAAAFDRNGDGTTCASATDTPGQRVLVVLDNVRAAASPQITTVPRVTATAR